MLISEVFKSLQGESSHTGLPCVFIRLAGCNLDCLWCDSAFARADKEGYIKDAREMSIKDILKEVERLGAPLVCVTGGEPLINSGANDLIDALGTSGHKVIVETNGTVRLDSISADVIKVVDVKCPSSGHSGSFNMDNLNLLTPADEVKFVISSRKDYDYAKRFLKDNLLSSKIKISNVIFSPIITELAPAKLAGWILTDLLDVRLGLQLHKIIWPNTERGV